MSDIDELQRLLDERGAEFKTHDTVIGKAVTWHGGVCDWVALPDEKGLAVGVYKDYLTPERAIAATLGCGTCVPHGEWERLSQTQEFRRMYCDCGYELGIDSRDSSPFMQTTYATMPRFCPECGARIVSKGKVIE